MSFPLSADSQCYKRIYWHSRRGMLELDLVLIPFVEQHLLKLDVQTQKQYQQLLTCEDQDLFAWLMRRSLPEDKELANIVGIILEHVSHRA